MYINRTYQCPTISYNIILFCVCSTIFCKDERGVMVDTEAELMFILEDYLDIELQIADDYAASGSSSNPSL